DKALALSKRDLLEDEALNVARLHDFAADRLSCRSQNERRARSQLSVAESGLVEQLKRAEVREFIVFHTDHFEPWSSEFLEEWQLAGGKTFARKTANHEPPRKLFFFYCPATPFSVERGERPMIAELQDSGVVATGRPALQQAQVTQAMAALRNLTGI